VSFIYLAVFWISKSSHRQYDVFVVILTLKKKAGRKKGRKKGRKEERKEGRNEGRKQARK
jgi:hypothetical protein